MDIEKCLIVEQEETIDKNIHTTSIIQMKDNCILYYCINSFILYDLMKNTFQSIKTNYIINDIIQLNDNSFLSASSDCTIKLWN